MQVLDRRALLAGKVVSGAGTRMGYVESQRTAEQIGRSQEGGRGLTLSKRYVGKSKSQCFANLDT